MTDDEKRAIIAAAYDRIDRVDALNLDEPATPDIDPMERWRADAYAADAAKVAAQQERRDSERRMLAEQQLPSVDVETLVAESRAFLLEVVGLALGELLTELTAEHAKTVAQLELRIASLETEWNRRSAGPTDIPNFLARQ
jgi:hypothetical protein